MTVKSGTCEQIYLFSNFSQFIFIPICVCHVPAPSCLIVCRKAILQFQFRFNFHAYKTPDFLSLVIKNEVYQVLQND